MEYCIETYNVGDKNSEYYGENAVSNRMNELAKEGWRVLTTAPIGAGLLDTRLNIMVTYYRE